MAEASTGVCVRPVSGKNVLFKMSFTTSPRQKVPKKYVLLIKCPLDRVVLSSEDNDQSLEHSRGIEFYFIFCVQRKKKVRAVSHELKLFSFGIDRRVLSFVVQQVCSSIASFEVAFRY